MTKDRSDQINDGRSDRFRGLFVFILIIQMFAFGLLIGPRVKYEDRYKYCVTNVKISENLGHSLNCDSSSFLDESNDLGLLLSPESRRQDRPGTIISAHVISQPLVWILNAASGLPAKKSGMAARFIGFFLMNILVLAWSCWLYLRTIGVTAAGGKVFNHAAALFSLTVFVNNNTKQFLWSPHSQIFAILSAMMAVYYYQAIQTVEKPARLFQTMALVCGILMLFYGIFVVPVSMIGLGYLWRERALFYTRAWNRIIHLAMIFVSAFILFALPYLLWEGFIIHRNGAFHHYDIEQFKGFTWIGIIAKQKSTDIALLYLGRHVWQMIYGGLLIQGAGFLALLLCLVWFARKRSGRFDGSAPLWAGGLIYILLTTAFFSAYGLTTMRLSYSLVLPLIPLIGFYLHRLEQNAQDPRKFRSLTVAGLFLYVLFMIAKFGPYS